MALQPVALYPTNKIDLTGQSFGEFKVIQQGPLNKKRGEATWLCLCNCGNKRFVLGNNLRRGNSKSCGCLKYSRVELSGFKWLKALYKRNAKSRNLKFELSDFDFTCLTKNNCYYCKKIPTNLSLNKGYLYNGIDRLDSNLGYVITNCVSCCTRCNIMKMDLSLTDFLTTCKIITENHGAI